MGVSVGPIYHGQQDCRSLRDAISKLLGADQTGPLFAKVRAGLVQRPDSVTTGMIFVEAEKNGERQFVRLPNCTGFNALTQDNQPLSLGITVLHESSLDENGVVMLVDGGSLRNVTMKPGEPVTYEFDDLDDAIVRRALRILGVEQRRYREISPEHLGGLLVLDYPRVRDIRLSHLKGLLAQIQLYFSSIPEARIKKALRRAGFQFPRSPRGVKAVAF